MITRPVHLTVQDFYGVHLSASNVASIYLSDDYLLRFGDAMLGLGSGVEPVTKCVAVTRKNGSKILQCVSSPNPPLLKAPHDWGKIELLCTMFLNTLISRPAITIQQNPITPHIAIIL